MKNIIKKLKKRNRAFTLIELIVVITIITILMSLILPAAQKVLASARKSKARTYMKQIAETYCRYYQDNGFIPDAYNNVQFLVGCASQGELNNANLFVFPGDKKAAAVLQENIWPVYEGYAWEEGKHLSVNLIANIAREVSAATTPVAFSRGLDVEGGRWSQEDGVWGSEGGFVAFLDGQVRWYTDLYDKLSTTSGSTESMQAAVDSIGGKILGTDTYAYTSPYSSYYAYYSDSSGSSSSSGSY
ncbi:MAG: prepilin-type N-terminal cleavage/methylation domain-containing protein [Puniceicoccales bacterium]|nr:prepilin-type N-terminal cleavage/methylation domain-containing protein [Puniceicoccales bacterium]